MAVAVIAGILFATFLTLVLVPVMYSLVDDVSDFFRRHYTHAGEEGGVGGDGERHEIAGSRDPSRGETQREPAGVYMLPQPE
jgi:hypothetical protein